MARILPFLSDSHHEAPVSSLRMNAPITADIDDTLHQALVRRWLPPRARDAHKGDFGPLLVIGGGEGYSGAALLAAETALRCGAGVTRVACAPVTAAGLWLHRPELMACAVHGRAELQPLLSAARVVVAGPGLGRGDWARGLWPTIAEAGPRQVLDADGLNWLADNPQPHPARVLTPHPGEAARLLGWATTAVQADRLAAVQALQARHGGVVILKGAGSLIADDARVWRCPAGNPGMATPGMGDILAGLVGALLAQGLPLFEAAALAVSLHARAGDRVAARSGERGLLASDLWPALRALLNPDVI